VILKSGISVIVFINYTVVK